MDSKQRAANNDERAGANAHSQNIYLCMGATAMTPLNWREQEAERIAKELADSLELDYDDESEILVTILKFASRVAAREREACAEAVASEKVSWDTLTENDRGYNQAIRHAVQAIRAMSVGETP